MIWDKYWLMHVSLQAPGQVTVPPPTPLQDISTVGGATRSSHPYITITTPPTLTSVWCHMMVPEKYYWWTGILCGSVKFCMVLLSSVWFCCSVWFCMVLLFCVVLWLCCSVWFCVVLCGSVKFCMVLLFCVVLYGSVVLCGSVWFCMVLCGSV